MNIYVVFHVKYMGARMFVHDLKPTSCRNTSIHSYGKKPPSKQISIYIVIVNTRKLTSYRICKTHLSNHINPNKKSLHCSTRGLIQLGQHAS